MTVRRILKSKGDGGVVTVSPEASLQEAAEVLASRRIGALVVSPDGREVVGILSERDVVREVGRAGPAVLGRPVSEVMTARAQTTTLDERAETVLRRMTEGRFRHLPVVEDGALAAMVSLGDVVKMRLDEISAERDALEGMVMGR